MDFKTGKTFVRNMSNLISTKPSTNEEEQSQFMQMLEIQDTNCHKAEQQNKGDGKENA